MFFLFVQVQLECTNLDECYFVQWQPAHLAHDNEEIFSITVIERDRKWFAENCSKLKEFWVDLMALRETYVPPPPPACLVNDGLYSARVDSSDDSVSHESSDDSVAQPGLQTLRRKLQDALDALDAFENRHKKWRV
jgi:hypothetical protein